MTSPFLGPVDPFEEDVPEELCPPGDGKLGLLYGTSASSGINTKRTCKSHCHMHAK